MKFFLLFTLVFMSVVTHAQQFGIRGGMNSSTIKSEASRFAIGNDSDKLFIGTHLGAFINFPLNRVMSIETGLNLNAKGHRSEPEDVYVPSFIFDPNSPSDEVMLISSKSKMRLYYFDVPMLIKFSYPIYSTDKRIYAAAGPYVGFGFYGKRKGYSTDFFGERIDFNDNIKWGSGDDNAFKYLDGGLTLGVGIEIDKFQIGVYYDYGLLNTASVTEIELEAFSYDFSSKNRVLRFSVAYVLGNLSSE